MRNINIARTFAAGSLAASAVVMSLSTNSLAQQPRTANQQPPARAAAPAAANADAVYFYSAGIDGLFVDEKDQGLSRALRMIDDRVLELPHEIPDFNAPPGVLQLVMDLLASPMAIRAGMLEGEEAANLGDVPPLYAQATFFAKSKEAADSLAGRFSGMVAMAAPAPSQAVPGKPGLMKMDIEGASLFHGSTTIGDQPAFVIAFNKHLESPLALDSVDLPQGVKPAMAFKFDYKKLQPLFDMMFAQAGPEGEQGKQQLARMGLYGPNATSLSFAYGHGQDYGHGSFRYANYRQIVEATGMAMPQPLNPADLNRVPQDATYAQVTRMDLSSIGRMLEQFAQDAAAAGDDEFPENPMEMVAAHTGIHPQRDLFDHLGSLYGVYMSDSTGGGGLFSLAGFVEVKNPDAIKQTIARINGMLNQMAQQHAKGYVRIAERNIEGQAITSLTFPGLPIPIEPSYAMVDNYLYSALSTQALLAAIHQGKQAKGGLMDNPRFKEVLGGAGQLEGAFQVGFFDTPRMIRGGYGLASLGAAALANAVRSPSNHGRDPGAILPTLTQLETGARASVTLTRVEGDDMIMTMKGDRSCVVNLTALTGMLGGFSGIATVGMMTGIMLPALGKARENARSLKSSAHLRQVSVAIQIYAADNNDKLPPSIDALLENDYVTAELLDSPQGPAPDGEDYFFHLHQGTISRVLHPDRTVLGYDRAMLASEGKTAVVFYDGHVEEMHRHEFERVISEPPNQDVDFDLPFAR